YYVNGTLVHSNLFTNKDGYIDVQGLEYGDYYFIESKAPTGYSINPEKVFFSITSENSSILQLFNFYDEKIVEERPTKPLPNTGVANNNLPIIIGVILIAVPVVGWTISKKKKK
ncbi:MAG: SpaA isopeptide-forming pilin-related protein, partial [Erysipelothrix sp.]